MEDTQVLELVSTAVNHALSILPRRVHLFLNVDQESLEMIRVHDPIIGVLLKELLDLVGGFAGGHFETPAEAEAHSVGLLGHGDRIMRGGKRDF